MPLDGGESPFIATGHKRQGQGFSVRNMKGKSSSLLLPPMLLLLLGILLMSFPEETEADCWNYWTGSRCDNETFWRLFGYRRCNDKCRDEGRRGGRCENSRETCGFLSRTVKVCRCF